ncbi:50S ribosomal protein L32e [Candidatus Pacearchaeota archaeon]|nr:MAG: 50S ribosomal protein L32e [Candidatus Pacearchaeota archaeon]
MKFLRRIWKRYSKLGRKRKNKQIWRKPKGRDNKMREKRRGYPTVVSIGYRTNKKQRGKIENLMPIKINNLKDLDKANEKNIVIIGRVGKKKKLEIIKKAKEKSIKIQNVNIKKFLKNNKEKGERK